MITPSKSFWKMFKKTNGALSCAEAVSIMNLAAMCPKGAYAEFGVHKGKSAMSAIVGLQTGLFNLVEPEFADDKFKEEAIFNIVAAAGEEVYLNPIADYSTNVLPFVDKLCYVMVDSGSHQDGLPMQEVKLLEDRMVKDGIIVFHDYQSQFSEVEQAYDYLVSTGKYEKVNIDWPLIIKHLDENNIEDGTNNSWHHTELKHPCFVGAVRRK